MIEVSFSHTTAVVGEPKDRACPFVSLSPDMEPVQKKQQQLKCLNAPPLGIKAPADFSEDLCYKRYRDCDLNN